MGIFIALLTTAADIVWQAIQYDKAEDRIAEQKEEAHAAAKDQENLRTEAANKTMRHLSLELGKSQLEVAYAKRTQGALNKYPEGNPVTNNINPVTGEMA